MLGRIVVSEDLSKFKESQTYTEITGFVESLAEAAQDKDLSPAKSANALRVEALLAEVANAVELFPSKERNSRFGKPEFQDFYDYLVGKTPEWLNVHLGIKDDSELARYFIESWGNRKRIDYGSGHELNFLCFLYSLVKLGNLCQVDFEDVVLSVFAQYLRTMRLVQGAYWLEPAGSHGVWGLDDYHFLPFLFGSAQLVHHKYLRPMSIHDEDLVEMYASKNYYFMCIEFINRVKTASLRWHSPMLDDISSAKNWQKVANGMQKMYRAEVLGKLPIMQHFMFSQYLPAPEGVTTDEDAELEHVHGWGDCCGIKIPSAIAATEQPKRKILPFD